MTQGNGGSERQVSLDIKVYPQVGSQSEEGRKDGKEAWSGHSGAASFDQVRLPVCSIELIYHELYRPVSEGLLSVAFSPLQLQPRVPGTGRAKLCLLPCVPWCHRKDSQSFNFCRIRRTRCIWPAPTRPLSEAEQWHQVIAYHSLKFIRTATVAIQPWYSY